MDKFTKEEISLCKQVAERYKKDIEYGDWMIIEGDPHFVPTLYIGQEFTNPVTEMLPLWTISDCLEFLRENVDHMEISQIKGGGLPNCYIYNGVKGIEETHDGKTPLEACLKAVLAVLEEKK